MVKGKGGRRPPFCVEASATAVAKEFSDAVKARAKLDPAFRAPLPDEIVQLILSPDLALA